MKVVVITGGSDGLGKAAAEALAGEFKVVVLARNEAALKKIAKQVGGDYVVCDVREPNQVATAFEHIAAKHGQIDVVINNAGVIVNGPLTDTADDAIANVITTNTLGTIFVAKAALRQMKQQGSGLIINVVSQAGVIARPERSVYNASKWAITGFTKALQQEAAPYDVRVSGFYPGTLQTELFAKAGIDMQGPALTTAQAVKALQFVIASDPDMLIPELGLKHLEG